MKTKLLAFIPLIFATLLNAQPAITVYNGGFGVVRDTVSLELQKGINAVSYSGVTMELEPESVVLRDPTGQVALSVLEQSYRGDPVDQARLLQLFEGKTIGFLKVLDDEEVIVKGKIVRAPANIMAKNPYGGRYEKHLQPIIEVDGALQTRLPGEPLFPNLGDDSVLLPTLSWKLFSDQEATLDAQLSYLTGGMSWKADYNLVMPEKGDVVTFTGWVSITNETGKTFDDAKIKLIAGDVNKVEEARVHKQSLARQEMPFAQAAAPEVEAKKFDEFHMYSLPLASTLFDRETKQVEFVRAEGVKTQKIYIYDGAGLGQHWRMNLSHPNPNPNYGQNERSDIAVYREFKNSQDNGGLGVALPAGKLRFYRMDSDGQLEFTGENTIDHTPQNETVRLYVGNAFDLVGERKRMSFYKHPTQDLMRERFEIQVRNRSEEAVTVQVVEPMFRWVNWKVIEHSHAFEQKDAQRVAFPVTVQPDDVVTVSYTVEYTW